MPALGDFQRLPKPSDIRRVPSGLAVPGISETPTAPLLPVQPLADPMVAKGFELQDGAMELPEPSDEVALRSCCIFSPCCNWQVGCAAHRMHSQLPGQAAVLYTV